MSLLFVFAVWSRRKVGPVDWIFIMWKCYLGDQAEALIEGLLEHGRLTLEQLIQRAAARGGKGNHAYWFCLNVPLILNNFFEFLDMVVEYLLATLRSSKWVMPLLTFVCLNKQRWERWQLLWRIALESCCLTTMLSVAQHLNHLCVQRLLWSLPKRPHVVLQ